MNHHHTTANAEASNVSPRPDSRTLTSLARVMREFNLTEIQIGDIRIVRAAVAAPPAHEPEHEAQHTPEREPERPTEKLERPWQEQIDSDPKFRSYLRGSY